MSPGLTRYAWLSIGASLGTLALKSVAWLLTGSVGLLSDALDSAALVLEAELSSSDPPHAERRTTAAATDSPVRHAGRIRRMEPG